MRASFFGPLRTVDIAEYTDVSGLDGSEAASSTDLVHFVENMKHSNVLELRQTTSSHSSTSYASQEQFWIKCTGRYRIDLPTEPRTTAMADPLTPPAQGSNEAETAKRSVAQPPVSTSVSSRTDKRSVQFSFNPAAKEFTPSSMPSGPSGPSAAMPPQAQPRPHRTPEWKPSNKIKDKSSTPTSWGERKKVSNKITLLVRNTPPIVTPPGGRSGSGASSPEPKKGSTPPQSKEEQPVPSEPSASPETLVEEAKKILAAMVNTGRANGKLEEALARMHPKAKGMMTLCEYAGIQEKPQGASEESR